MWSIYSSFFKESYCYNLDYNCSCSGKTGFSEVFFHVQPLCARPADGCPVGPGPWVDISILNHSLSRSPTAPARSSSKSRCSVSDRWEMCCPKHGVEWIPPARPGASVPNRGVIPDVGLEVWIRNSRYNRSGMVLCMFGMRKLHFISKIRASTGW